MVFTFFFLFLIALRVGELWLARRNERWLLQHEAREYGQAHYPWMVGMHTLFFVSLLTEYSVRGTGAFHPFLLFVFLVLICGKAWVIFSLGKYWNTKIYRIPGVALVRKGPYRLVKHPNYMIVIAEILLIPLIFDLYYTAVIFTVLNGIMLLVRIREENKILAL